MKEPKIRYINGSSWSHKKVGDLCNLLTGFPFPGDSIMSRGENLLMRGINITEGTIRHSDEIDRYYSGNTIGLEKYRLQVGDLVIGMDGSKVGKNSALVTEKEKESLLVQRVVRLRNEDKNLINIIKIAVSSSKFIKYVEEIKTSSAIPHISPTDIRNFTLSLPNDKTEREAIASFFTTLDAQISASTSRLASLKQIKAASLQAMFPQEGETVPKLRFKGFEGEWKTSLVGEVCKISTGKSNTQDKIEDGEFPFYVRSPYVERSNKYLYDEEAVLTVGDGVGTGKVFHYVNGKYDLHQRVYRMFDFHNIQAKYFYYLFSTQFYKRVMSMTAKSSVDSVRMDMIADMKINVPAISEQQSIASYFTNLDRQITLQTNRLEKLKQIKAACLDKMFV